MPCLGALLVIVAMRLGGTDQGHGLPPASEPIHQAFAFSKEYRSGEFALQEYAPSFETQTSPIKRQEHLQPYSPEEGAAPKPLPQQEQLPHTTTAVPPVPNEVGMPPAESRVRTVSYEPDVKVTHYGTRFSGRKLGCGDGLYASEDLTIVAVASDRNKQWRCGFLMEICGEGGCIIGMRLDTCPGCGTNHVDLTEEGLDAVCGKNKGVCQASLRVYAPTDCMIPEGIPADGLPVPQPEADRLLTGMMAVATPDLAGVLLEWSSGAKSKSCRAVGP